MTQPKIVSREEWLRARKQLLAKEKDLTRRHDALAEERRQLPWVRVDEYVFEGPTGKVTLSELFDRHTQLVVYHFMLGPGWDEGCPVCSLVADQLDALRVHLPARDVALTLVSRAPFAEIDRFKRRMGWQVDWVSSHGTTFNRDFNVSFSKEEVANGKAYYNYDSSSFVSEEAGGVSIFCKNHQGEVFHTYSAYERGAEPLLAVYGLLDLVPKGRDEEGLPWPMAWVRHHDKYGQLTSA